MALLRRVGVPLLRRVGRPGGVVKPAKHFQWRVGGEMRRRCLRDGEELRGVSGGVGVACSRGFRSRACPVLRGVLGGVSASRNRRGGVGRDVNERRRGSWIYWVKGGAS